MAILSNSERRAIWAEWMRENDEDVDITKADLRAAFDTLDDWLNTNAATVNATIPQPARGSLSTRQKAWIFTKVIEKRFKVGA